MPTRPSFALPDPARLRAVLVTLVAATLGGALFKWLGIPLPWMLGAMTATGLLAWHDRAEVLKPVRPAALILLGLGLGQTFTPTVMAAVMLALPWLLGAALLSILVGVLVARLFARWAGTDAETGYYAAVPGGVVVMAVLAQRAGLSVPTVTLAHTIRVMLVVALVPPLVGWLAPLGTAGAFLAELPQVRGTGLLGLLAGGLAVALAARRLGMANPWMLAPCGMMILLSALDVLPSGVPSWMVDAAQVGMGMALGQRMSRRFLLSSHRLALASVAMSLLLMAVMAVLAIAFSGISGLPVAEVALGMSPGGMPEMTVTAKALSLGVPLVLGFHIVRTLLCNFAVAPIWRGMVRLGLAR
ncbi:AbrB family transcriptional regulator [Falsiroseomonas sp.]|uniref:AbrB family transcriptional regulator n=1 Tax=Falsiroseomonas sp. TaxID=2870721 RepID=UPI0034A28C55